MFCSFPCSRALFDVYQYCCSRQGILLKQTLYIYVEKEREKESIGIHMQTVSCIATCLKVEYIAPIKCRVTALNFHLDFCIGELYDTPTIICKYSSLFCFFFHGKHFRFSFAGNGNCPGIACANVFKKYKVT